MTTPSRVTVEIAEGVAHVRLSRAEKLNALDPAMFRGLVEAGSRLADDDAIRAVVVSGEGRAFCAGLDFARFAELASSGGRSEARAVAIHERIGGAQALGQQAVRVWSQVGAPVIAAIHGVAYGGGLQIALGADIRIAAPDAKLSVMEINWGLIPDMAGTQLLPDLVGRDVAMDLTLTGRTVDGSDGVSLGLVTRVADDPLGHALEMAHSIASRSPKAVRHAKRLINLSGRVSIDEGLDGEQKAIAELLADPALKETIRSRLTRFQGPGKSP